MTAVVGRHEIAIVGEFSETFSTAFEIWLARKILRESTKSEFQKTIFKEMRAFNT